MLFVVPLRWILAAGTAAMVHELGHILAVWALDGEILSLTMHPSGMVLECSPFSAARQILASLAGPAGGLMLLFLLPRFPLIALCGTVQSLWNLLPVGNSDGKNVLRCVLHLHLSGERTERVCRRIERLCAGMVVLGVLWAAGRGFFSG